MITPNNLKIVFWGTSEFAILALEALLAEGYSIAAIVTTPDKPVGRKQLLTPPPVKSWLMKHESQNTIPILQPEKLSDANLKSDIFVVASYGKIIPADILALPKYGALNIHPSLLPHWRGPSPIQYTISNGDMETGVTIIKMDEKVDHGGTVANRKVQIANRPTYQELHDMLATLGAELLIRTLPKYLAGEITPKPQDESQATYSKLLKKEDGHIDWSRPAEEIERMARAFNPWPGAYTFWERDGKQLQINLLEVSDVRCQMSEAPGKVTQNENGITIETNDGCIQIHKLQLEGKKPTDAQSFLNGYLEIIGQVLT